LETFDIETQGARALLARFPLHVTLDPPFGQTPHLLLAGLAAPAWAFLDQALQIIQYGNDTPVVTLLCEDPACARTDFGSRYPQAFQVADIRFVRLEETPPLVAVRPVTLALVCLDDPLEARRQAERLAREIARLQQVSPLILVEMGLQMPSERLDTWDGQIVPVSHVRESDRDGTGPARLGDEIARTIHDHYRDTFEALGGDPETNPALQPWTSLPDTYQRSSRHQADHITAKLSIVDCLAVPEGRVEFFAFSPLEVERLAVVEHQRWAAERYLDGWTHGPERVNALKRHPDLIPYAALSEAAKDKDRFAVRHITHLLARLELGIVRLLIVGLDEASVPNVPDRRSRLMANELLERLESRYPDRELVLASTLMHPMSRQLVRQALEPGQARLFWLLPVTIADVLAGQPDESARLELLALAARAERRIQLQGADELSRWLRERAEILVEPGGRTSESLPVKRVVWDPESNRLDWNFEY
jgi:hypothetical protein